MKNLKRIFTALMVMALPFTLTSCYQPDYNYVAVETGQLKGPSISRADKDAYRAKYGTLDAYEEEITITVAACEYAEESGVKPGTTPENQTFNQLAKEYLNINLEYVVVADVGNYDTKLNLSIANKKMPDMFFTSSSALYSQLLNSNMLADLSDAFWYLNDELQENYLTYFPELLPTVMQEGKLYSFPAITNTYQSAQRLYIRQDWLDIVGMEAPTTMEEFVAVGQAFVDKSAQIGAATGIDPIRLIPFTMSKDITYSGSFSVEGFLNCFGTSMNAYFEGEDGQLYYSNTSPEMKAAVSELRNLYSKKILDQDFIGKNSELVQADIKAGYVGMVFGEWWMSKDVLDSCVNNPNVKGANWTWVNVPNATENEEAQPIVNKVGVGGYNLVSKNCKHPEAAAKLINLFYDIYYNDAAADEYGDLILPSNGFYYQYVPIKLWDGISSIREYERVQDVFETLYNEGFDPSTIVDSKLYAEKGILQEVTTKQTGDYVVSEKNGVYSIINRDVIAAIEANDTWSEAFNTMRNREKVLHFADGYPYYVAYMKKTDIDDMTVGEKRGWGIYHEMIDPTGGYSYVVELTNDKTKAKYNCFFGANLSAMVDFSEYITKETSVKFTSMITGQMSVDKFDSDYVQKVFNKNGGNYIMDQVNQWYQYNNIDYDYIYALVK